MTAESKDKQGLITRIYGENRKHLVARGIGADGLGFSERPLEIDERMQVIVKLDDGTVATLQNPKKEEV